MGGLVKPINKMEKDPNLGKTGTDKVTGLTGVITGRCDYLDRDSIYLLSPLKEPGIPKELDEWVPITSVIVSE